MQQDGKGWDTGYEWKIILILSLTFGLVGLDRFILPVLFPAFMGELGLTYQDLGNLVGILAVFWGISAFAMGFLSDRVGRRKVLIPAVIVFSLMSALSGMVGGLVSLLLIRAVMGLAEGPVASTGVAVAVEASHPKRRGMNNGIFQCMISLMGNAIGPIIATQLLLVTTWRTVLEGIAKPMPTLPLPPPPVAICEFTPITCAFASSSGPPELPGLMAASVWITESISKPFGASMWRPTAETMPSVAVRSSPKGLPIATVGSPIRTVRESANCSGLTPSGIAFWSMLTTARSSDGSVPTTFPSSDWPREPKRTITRLDAPTTWAFVTSLPSREIRKPVPEPSFVLMDTTAGLACAYTEPAVVRAPFSGAGLDATAGSGGGLSLP